MQSLIFDFRKSPTFLQKWNKEFDVEDIEATCFYIVLVDDICDDNFSDCVNQDNQIKYSEDHLISSECYLKYVIDGTNEKIALDGDVTIDFDGETNPESFSLKGAFLTNDNGYIMGYSINQQSFNVTNQMIFEDDLVFFDIIEGVLND